jgi:uncharacterized membrane protein
MKKNIKTDIVMLVLVSFIGFWFENIWMVCRHGILDNRNMFLPFLLGYGVFIIALSYVLGTPNNLCNRIKLKRPYSTIIYYLICVILVSIGELLLGLFVEKTGGFSYWDYSTIPLHVTKYTSLPTSLGFALVITLFMDFVFIPLRNKIQKLVEKIPLPVVIIILLILVVDFFISFKTMYTNNGKNTLWIFHFR